MAASLPGGAARSCRAKARGPIWAGAAAILALAGCGGEGSAARGRPSSRIAFVSERDGNAEIYVMNADGSGLARLTDDPASDGMAAWSPDGTKLVFESNRAGPADLWVVNADGSGLTRLTNPGYSHHWPAWSRDGTKIVFERHSGFDTEGEVNPVPNIYVISADGSGLRRLTRTGEAEDHGPAWSPDGTRLAFARRENTGRSVWITNIWVIDADGSAPRMLTSAPEDHNTDPNWSPEGTRLAFVRREREGSSDIWVMNADGCSGLRLTNAPEDDTGPNWSPDGTRLAFVRRERERSSDIWVMNAHGSGVTRLTDHPALDEAPAWSPDGTRLAFHSNRDGNYEIYVMNADGSGVTRLTDHPAPDRFPSWSPVGQAPSAPAPAGSQPSGSAGSAAGLESFGPRFAPFERQLAPLLASLDSVQARMRRDSGTARADSAFLAFRCSFAARVPSLGEDFERWLVSDTAARDSAQRFSRARGLILEEYTGDIGDTSELEYWLAADSDFLLARLGAYLTGPMRGYHETEAQQATGFNYEGAYVLTWDELAENIVKWEAFLEANPGFVVWDSLWSVAQARYARYLSDFVRGPGEFFFLFQQSSGRLDSDARASYERLLARHGGTQAARFVRGLLDVLRRTGYRDGPERREYLRITPWPTPGRRRPGS